MSNHAELMVIGAGPGGYACAFRAADLGRNVVMVDPRATRVKLTDTATTRVR